MTTVPPFHLSLFGTVAFTAASLVWLSHPAAAVFHPLPQGERYQTGNEERRAAALEREEERLDAEAEELTVPLGSPLPTLIIVMGVASCGKSTIGNNLAEALDVPFIDADDLHPASNVAKMSAGNPLNDDDRLPWLALLRSTAERVCREQYENGNVSTAINRPAVVIACSALKKWYRDILRGNVDAEPPSESDLPAKADEFPENISQPATSRLQTLFVYCHGSKELLEARIAARKNHFMGAKMLASQLATLEDPRCEEGVSSVEIAHDRETVGRDAVLGVKKALGLRM